MNIAVTNGLVLTPPDFSAGLRVWSRENGTAGSATWHGASNASIVPADQDFGTCLEIVKQQDVTQLRFMGETPILPGTYLRISARLKMVAGTICQARIAGWPGDGGRRHVSGLTQTGVTVTLGSYGQVTEISAIVSPASRQGVTMAWGLTPVMGHFGLDLVGPNGGAVRIESIRIEDVSADFLVGSRDWVDVRDYGAVGDGVTNCRAAFLAADAAAAGGQILVPEGTYRLASDTSLSSPVRFKGKLTMPDTARLALLSSFDFPTYAAAFGDETLGLKKALQALFGYVDHTVLDLRGRRVDLTEPLEIAKYAPGLTSFGNRRMIVNGQINVTPGTAWESGLVTSQARYDPARPLELTEVANVANIEVGSLISGMGVGREVYVRAKNVAQRSITLSQPFYGGATARNYQFTRFRYIFDFSGIDKLDRLTFANVEFLMNGNASAVLLPGDGWLWQFQGCHFTGPKNRGITSIGWGCQGMQIDNCQFISSELSALAQDRVSIGMNSNANDVKIRNNQFVRFGTSMVIAGTGTIISGNHWFQGDDADLGMRVPGLVLTAKNAMTTITGNYVDNNTIEWCNEHDPYPQFTEPSYSFGGLTIDSNHFVVRRPHEDFVWFSVKPMGAGHFVHGLSVTSNVFKTLVNRIKRVDRVDNSVADLNYNRMRNITYSGNSFNGVNTYVANPVCITHNQNTAQANWLVPVGAALPLGGWANKVDALVLETAITDGANRRVVESPVCQNRRGSDMTSIQLNWSQAVKGTVSMWVRTDQPG
ncbi:MAG: glycosyl hydrolase family 28-related protein [Paracoccus sp. (in: a-proteobacteria)]|uniref:glycosyl hydrolase family 28-related protein n=1 Tax=Paracoccus sp. TaxID=267 RepID=UPI0026DF70C4|nr:glycosyl hydrolase family 28-related protein [Paracoccus sp. (in: a-proteobacteria)]MDO5622056.1 glycosyl hydrolase family 28-related protein [Paracoccus sp. (in: a-proteobacteria)]